MLRAWALPLQKFGSDQHETCCANAGTIPSPGDSRTNYDDQPAGGIDGEQENTMHVSEQHQLVYSGDALTVLPVLQDV